MNMLEFLGAAMSRLTIFLFIFHYGFANMTTTELLNSVEKNKCGNQEFCMNSTEYRQGLHCQCDPDCSKYGDCCRDSPHFQPKDTHFKFCKAVIKSETDFIRYVSMVGSCPDDWQDNQVRQSCQSPNILGDDPLTNGIPMTDTSKTVPVTYRNTHCAVCNRADPAYLRIWKAKLKCHKVKSKQPSGSKIELGTFRNKWAIMENGTKYPCMDLIPVLPRDLDNLRSCPPYIGKYDFFKDCPDGWKDSTTDTLCKSYTAYVFNKTETFQNIYCAECRGVNPNVTQCHQLYSLTTGYGSELFSFQELLDFEYGEDATPSEAKQKRSCGEKYEVYDPFSKRCRRLFNDTHERLSPNQHSTRFKTCKEFFLTNETYELASDNRSVWFSTLRKTYSEGEFYFTEDGQLAVCAVEYEEVTHNKLVKGMVTYIGLGISIIFLTLHLCAFALVPELRNLSGRSLASLCVALLFGYVCFIIGGLLEVQDKPFCVITSVLIYYFFLSAFAWMLVIGFDVWRALMRALHFQSCRGGQWHRFFAYSAFAWLTPAVMTSLAVAADYAPSDMIHEDLRPGFGSKKCWFSNNTSLIIFFGSPLTLVMILNVGFFSSAAWMTMGTRPCGMAAGASGAKRDFRLYLRLGVMVGLTWLVGLVANVLKYTGLWFLFMVLNTLQGLFIFAMFTCTAKVFRGLGQALPWTESFRYSLSSYREKRATKTQSTSWTGASNDTLQDSAFGSSSDKENPELSKLFPKNKIRL